ncbi:FtsX-like permease family protein [Flexivirga sp. B27]
MNLSIVVSALSVLAALVSVVLVAVASRADRERDLRALRTGGLPRRVVRAATVGEFVLLALVGSVIGAATAPFAAWLTGRTMLWWSTPPDQPLTKTGFQWTAGVSAAIALIVVLVVVATAFGTRIARSASQQVRGNEV